MNYNNSTKLLMLSLASLILIPLSTKPAALESEMVKKQETQKTLNDQLLKSAKDGDTPKVYDLLDKGAVVYTRDKDEWTPLMLASENGHAKIVDLLLKHGANVNAVDKNGSTALKESAREGHADIVNALLEHNANFNVADAYGNTALLWAAVKGHINIVNALLNRNADLNVVNQKGNTALMAAISMKHREITRMLYDAGALLEDQDMLKILDKLQILETQEDILRPEDKRRLMILREKREKQQELANQLAYAASYSKLARIEELLAEGADINARNDAGYTALIHAALGGNIEIIERLLTAGADVDIKDEDYGYTALIHAAARIYNVETIERLLTADADVNIKGNDGKTALMVAAENNNAEIVKLLLKTNTEIPEDISMFAADIQKLIKQEARQILVKSAAKKTVSKTPKREDSAGAGGI